MNKNVYAGLALASGILCAVLFMVLTGLFENYFVRPGLGEIMVLAYRMTLSFMLGLYLFAILQWIVSKREKEYVPLVVVVDAVGGIILGSIASSLLMPLFSISLPEALGWIFDIIEFLPRIMVLVFVFLAVRFSCRYEKKLPQSMVKRYIFGGIGILILAVPLLASLRGFDFPARSPLAERHAWALKKFDETYPAAVAYIKNSPVIQADVGDNIAVGPASFLRNIVSYAIDGCWATYNLEVQGNRGRGTCRIEAVQSFQGDKSGVNVVDDPVYDPERWPMWEFNGRKVILKGPDSEAKSGTIEASNVVFYDK